MELSGSVIIPLPRTTVWRGLNDTDVLGEAIPGCEEISRASETEIDAVVAAKVGPVKAKFKGVVTLSNVVAPSSYTLTGEGKGGAAGFAKGSVDVTMTEHPEGTEISYSAGGRVGGKLSQLGARLLKGVAEKTAGEFFSKFADACIAKYGD